MVAGLGRLNLYIPTLAKNAKDWAPVLFGSQKENKENGKSGQGEFYEGGWLFYGAF
jgi:hypothetical protein